MKTITPTEEDLVLAFKLHSITNPNTLLLTKIAPWKWLLIIIGTCCLIGYFLVQKINFIHDLILLVGGLFIFLGIIPFITPYLMKIVAQSLWKKNKILQMPFTLAWNENLLFIESSKAKSDLKWCLFTHMVQNEHYILMYLSQDLFFHMPKRYFDDNKEIQDFLGYLQAGIAQNKADTNF